MAPKANYFFWTWLQLANGELLDEEKKCLYQNAQNSFGEIVNVNKIDMNKNDNNTCRITEYEQLT